VNLSVNLTQQFFIMGLDVPLFPQLPSTKEFPKLRSSFCEVLLEFFLNFAQALSKLYPSFAPD